MYPKTPSARFDLGYISTRQERNRIRPGIHSELSLAVPGDFEYVAGESKNNRLERHNDVRVEISGGPLAVRIIVVVILLGLAGGLTAAGHDLATAALLAAGVLGCAADLANRLSLRAWEVGT